MYDLLLFKETTLTLPSLKIIPLNFVATLAFWKADSISLQSLAAEITTQIGQQISAQAIAEKLAKPETEVMFQTLVRLALDSAATCIDTTLIVTIPGANKILVADSSQIALNDKLRDELPGTGNTKPNALLKVHAPFSLRDIVWRRNILNPEQSKSLMNLLI